jgi:chromate reductase
VLILGVCGSLRQGSYNRRLLRAAAASLPAGIDLEIWERLDAVPPYSEDADRIPGPEPIEELRGAVRQADGVLIATPEYNSSIPGQLKNALDWASRPYPANVLRDKPVAVIGASTGLFGAVWAQAELRKVLGAIGATVVDDELPVARAHEALAPDGSIRDPSLAESLAAIVRQLVAEIRPAVERVA